MKRLGAYEAKTNLSRLLDEVERGESYAITKHGRIVAHIVPPVGSHELTVDQAIDGLRRFRQGHRLNGISIRELIEEGRRR
jgi:prevent-host-death family protein